jgi:hypothetical protein
MRYYKTRAAKKQGRIWRKRMRAQKRLRGNVAEHYRQAKAHTGPRVLLAACLLVGGAVGGGFLGVRCAR